MICICTYKKYMLAIYICVKIKGSRLPLAPNHHVYIYNCCKKIIFIFFFLIFSFFFIIIYLIHSNGIEHFQFIYLMISLPLPLPFRFHNSITYLLAALLFSFFLYHVVSVHSFQSLYRSVHLSLMLSA